MGRLLVLAIVVVVLIWLLRRATDDGDDARAGRDADRGRRGDAGGGGGQLVRCAACGLHLPAGEARRVRGRYYCSDEHARRAAGEA